MTTFRTLGLAGVVGVLVTLAAVPAWAQAPRPPRPALRAPVQKLVNKLRAGHRWEPKWLGGFVNEPSRQFAIYEKLARTATADELRSLARHPSPCVRAYAFLGLLEGRHDIAPLLLERLTDHAWLKTAEDRGLQGHPFGGRWRVADVLLFMAWSGTGVRQGRTLAEEERGLIRDRVLATASPLRFQAQLLNELGTPPERYAQVRALAKGDSLAALEALARYRKPDDLKLIAARFAVDEGRAAAFAAMRAFPHPTHFEQLLAFEERALAQEREGQRLYFRAVAAQEDPRAADLLGRGLKTGSESQRTRTLRVVAEVLDEVREEQRFRKLLWRLVEGYKGLSPRILRHLAVEDPEQMLLHLGPLLRSKLYSSEAREFLVEFLARERTTGRKAVMNDFLEWAGRKPSREVSLSLTKLVLERAVPTLGDARTRVLLEEFVATETHRARRIAFTQALNVLR
jgi:hypothetical protein